MANRNNENRPTRNPSFSDGELLSPEIQAVIDGWRPQKMERAKLANVPAVLETVRECVAAAKPTNPKMARSCLRTTTEILLWAYEEFGHVDVAEALNPHNIEYFIAHVSHSTEPGGQSNTRWILRRVAHAVCPTGMPAKAPRYGRSTVAQPYTEPDEEVFRFMVADSDASNRAGRLAVVALSLGAGLRGDEVAAAMPNDLEFRDDGRVVVNVRG